MTRALAVGRSDSRSAILTFFGLTLAWTWGFWWASVEVKPSAPMVSNVLYLAGAFGPSLAAIAVTAMFSGGEVLRAWFKRCLRWRIGWVYYALALGMPLLIMIAAIALHAVMGGSIPASPVAGHLWVAIAQVPLVLIFGGPLGEEFGWRGYALPAMAAHIGWRWASIILGGIWVLWHLPLLFMAGAAQADVPIVLFVVSTIGLSVVMARLAVQVSFSVLPAILLHSMINWASMALPIMPEAGDVGAYAIVVAITMAAAAIALQLPGPRHMDGTQA